MTQLRENQAKTAPKCSAHAYLVSAQSLDTEYATGREQKETGEVATLELIIHL